MTSVQRQAARWHMRPDAMIELLHLPPWATSRLVVPGRAARRLGERSRRQRLLHAAWPVLSRSLELDPGWRVHRVPPTVGNVTVALVGGSAPAAVLKIASTPQGTAALERSAQVVELLESDARLADWSHVLPRRLRAIPTHDGELVVLEQLLPGRDAASLVTGTDLWRVVPETLRCIGALHQATTAVLTVGQALLQRWVDEPLLVLARWYADGGRPRSVALDQLRARLHNDLAGREVRVGWIHGDLHPGNVLLRPDTLEVSGLLDWERADHAGLPDVDVAHLLLSVRMATQRRELGELVCRVLDGRTTLSLDGEVPEQAAVLLCWLHHVSGIVSKTDRFRCGGYWAARNVDLVVAHAEAWSKATSATRSVARPRPLHHDRPSDSDR